MDYIVRMYDGSRINVTKMVEKTHDRTQRIKQFLSLEVLDQIRGAPQDIIRYIVFNKNNNIDWEHVLNVIIELQPEKKRLLKVYNLDSDASTGLNETFSEFKKLSGLPE